MLAAVVVGSGIFAQRLSPDDIGLQLLENSTATAAGLVALILTFGAVSGAHFNPVVSLADRGVRRHQLSRAARLRPRAGRRRVPRGDRRERDVRPRCRSRSPHKPIGQRHLARRGRRDVRPRAGHRWGRAFRTYGHSAVRGGWLHRGGLLVHVLDELRQPRTHAGRTLTDTFAGIKPSSAPAFIVAELLGAGARGRARVATCTRKESVT